MNRIVAVCGCSLALLAAAAGCGDTTEEPTTTETPALTAPEDTTQEQTTEKEKPTPPPAEKPDPGEDRQAYFTQMDDYAIALDEAVAQAFDGDAHAAKRVEQLRKKIADRVTDWALEGHDTSVGGNLLLSAATSARDALRSRDLPQLARSRRTIAEAKTKLADEVTP